MIHLRIRTALPEGFGVYLIDRGKRRYLSEDEEIELALRAGKTVALMQDGPMTGLQKALAAIGIFLTAPLQLAFAAPLDKRDRDRVIPYRMEAKLRVSGEAVCRIALKEGWTREEPPRLIVTGENVRLAECRWSASPWVLHEVCFVELCRILGGAVWLLGLLGYLLAVGISGKNPLGILTAGVGCILIAAVSVLLSAHTFRENRRRAAGLKQR